MHISILISKQVVLETMQVSSMYYFKNYKIVQWQYDNEIINCLKLSKKDAKSQVLITKLKNGICS